MKAEPGRLIPRKPIATLELLFITYPKIRHQYTRTAKLKEDISEYSSHFVESDPSRSHKSFE